MRGPGMRVLCAIDSSRLLTKMKIVLLHITVDKHKVLYAIAYGILYILKYAVDKVVLLLAVVAHLWCSDDTIIKLIVELVGIAVLRFASHHLVIGISGDDRVAALHPFRLPMSVGNLLQKAYVRAGRILPSRPE